MSTRAKGNVCFVLHFLNVTSIVSLFWSLSLIRLLLISNRHEHPVTKILLYHDYTLAFIFFVTAFVFLQSFTNKTCLGITGHFRNMYPDLLQPWHHFFILSFILLFIQSIFSRTLIRLIILILLCLLYLFTSLFVKFMFTC